MKGKKFKEILERKSKSRLHIMMPNEPVLGRAWPIGGEEADH
jgi:hypothetical protein